MQFVLLHGISALLHTLVGSVFLILILTPQSLFLNKEVKSDKFGSIFKSTPKLSNEISPITIDYENIIFCSKPLPSSSFDFLFDVNADDHGYGFAQWGSNENSLIGDENEVKETKNLLSCFLHKDKARKRDCLCFSHISIYVGLSTAILSIVAGTFHIIMWSSSFSQRYNRLTTLCEYCALGFSAVLTVLWLISDGLLWRYMRSQWPYKFANNHADGHFYEPLITWKIAATLLPIPLGLLFAQIVYMGLLREDKTAKTCNLPPAPASSTPVLSERAGSEQKRSRRASGRRRNEAGSPASAPNVFVVKDLGVQNGQSAPVTVNFGQSANTMVFRSELKLECCHDHGSEVVGDDLEKNKGKGVIVEDRNFKTMKKPPAATYYQMQNPLTVQQAYDNCPTESAPDQSVIFANPSPNSVPKSKMATPNDVKSAASVQSQFARSTQSTSASSETISAPSIPSK